MIQLKSNFEIDKIRRSGKILSHARAALKKAIKPGVTPNQLDKLFRKIVLKEGGKLSFKNYQGFPKAICVSTNDELIHAIPDDRQFKEHDLVSIDMGVIYDGFHSDAAFSISVGASTPENDLLIKVAKESFQAGFEAIKPGARIGDISAAIGKVIKRYKMYTTYDYAGHGIGRNLHEEPYVFNFGDKNTGIKLRPGLVIAIEPMILQDSPNVEVDANGWTVRSVDGKKTSHYEHTIAIKEDGYPEILTKG